MKTHPGIAYPDTSHCLAAAKEACSRIAPSWPLDRSIAVNPWWKHIDKPFTANALRLASLSGARAYMDRAWYREKWEDGTIGYSDLRAACRIEGQDFNERALFDHLHNPTPRGRLVLVTLGMDAWRDLRHNVSWEEEVVYQVSQVCAAYFDQGQSIWRMDNSLPLYQSWKASVVHELGIGLLTGAYGLEKHFSALPDSREDLLEEALKALGIPENRTTDYLEALLLSINGWASWCAWRRWQDGLEGTEVPDSSIEDLLAIRLAWEWVLLRHAHERGIPLNWPSIVDSWELMVNQQRRALQLDQIWQRALELSGQGRLCQALSRPLPGKAPVRAEVAAWFCIDVRSEPLRRALEAQDDRIRTGGFAGFFGIPMAYQGAGLDVPIPHLPGLLSHSHTARDCAKEQPNECRKIVRTRRHRLQKAGLKDWLASAATTVFSYVEAAGLLYGLKLLRDSLGWDEAPACGLTRRERSRLHPALELTVEESTRLAAGVLQGMTLTRDFPELVLLAGHGSESPNNPHAAGLQCGACCGQSGEVNARVLARILNDPGTRQRLKERGIHIPGRTRFLAGLHNTTTDEVSLFDLEELPSSLSGPVARLQEWLRRAGDSARRERASRLGIRCDQPEGLLGKFRRRARDWSQVRPEWGLAKNNSFIVAPRQRTRHLDLQGRSFLHDYDWRDDPEFRILEQIMTAPMIVTHWINLQYYASTVDNRRYGSGNKVLHNVVGGKIGVFEGNGGDLRIGLPLQSLHDGSRWIHEPVRLSVFIEAPRDAIDRIRQQHETVRHLVDNEWLHLFQLEPGSLKIHRHTQAGWRCVRG